MTTQLMLSVVADENSADYLREETDVTDFDELSMNTLGKVSRIVMQTEGCNWCTSPEELSDEEIEVPGAEYGVHTVDSIELREVTLLIDFSKP
jgi:hypothetical protein